MPASPKPTATGSPKAGFSITSFRKALPPLSRPGPYTTLGRSPPVTSPYVRA